MTATTGLIDAARIARPRAADAALPVIVLFTLVAALLPVLVNAFPVADDFLNHLARCYVILRHGSDHLLDQFYTIRWKVVPNLAIDLIVPPLAGLIGLYAAGKAFVLAYMLLLLSGPHAIHYAINRHLSVGPLVAALFLYNQMERYGTVNYEFGVGLALWAVALWIALRQAAPLLRGAVSTLAVVVLFFCHLEAVAIYGVAIAAVEAERLWARRSTPRLLAADLAALLLPFVPSLLLLASGPHTEAPPPMHWGGWVARLDGLRAALEAYYAWPDAIAVAAMTAGLGWLLWRRILRVPAGAWLFMAFGGVLFAVIPDQAMGAWGAAVRLPIGLLFVLIGLLRWQFPGRRARMAFLMALAALVTLRSAAAEVAYRRYNEIRRDFGASLPLIPPGSRVLVAREWQNAIPALSGIQDLPSLVMIERSSLDSLAYSHPLQQVLVVRAPYRASTGGYDDNPIPLADLLDPPSRPPPGGFRFDPSGRIYWKDWQRTYDYVYLLDRLDRSNPAPDRLDLLRNGDRFQLFRVRRP